MFVSEKQSKRDEASVARVRSTMKLFETTLIALKDSGKAPLSYSDYP